MKGRTIGQVRDSREVGRACFNPGSLGALSAHASRMRASDLGVSTGLAFALVRRAREMTWFGVGQAKQRALQAHDFPRCIAHNERQGRDGVAVKGPSDPGSPGLPADAGIGLDWLGVSRNPIRGSKKEASHSLVTAVDQGGSHREHKALTGLPGLGWAHELTNSAGFARQAR